LKSLEPYLPARFLAVFQEKPPNQRTGSRWKRNGNAYRGSLDSHMHGGKRMEPLVAIQCMQRIGRRFLAISRDAHGSEQCMPRRGRRDLDTTAGIAKGLLNPVAGGELF
jgi:hypothetical protein